jgi:Ca2+-binding RTX toxin-like protein
MERPRIHLSSKLVGCLAAATVLCAVLAPAAAADVRVSINQGQLNVDVVAKNGSDGNHELIVEGFVDAGRDGFRVRQALPRPGHPAITSNDGNCDTNPLLNDVVCVGPRNSVQISGGDGADSVLFAVQEGGGCVENPDVGPVTFDLGRGADAIASAADLQNDCAVGAFIESSFLPVFDGTGGRNGDTVNGTPRSDDLAGGAGEDVIRGGDSRDILRDGGEDDEVFGDDGNDSILSGLGDDLLVGNAGIDTVNYGTRSGVLVTTGIEASGDGSEGEEDNVSGTVENVEASLGDDEVIADTDDDDNRFEGLTGDDRLVGNRGEDVLLGNQDNDEIVGSGDQDSLLGGDGSDTINASDGIRDAINCGPGRDLLIADLFDPLGGDCERLMRAPVDDGPPGHVVGRRLRGAGDGTTTLRVVCPRKARVRCRGRLTLRRPGGGGALGRRGYDIAVGGRERVTVKLSSVPRTGSRVFAHTVEKGASQKGPRSSRLTLVVAG